MIKKQPEIPFWRTLGLLDRVRHMYLNANLDAIYEPVLYFLWVLMIKPINFDILMYSGPKQIQFCSQSLQKMTSGYQS